MTGLTPEERRRDGEGCYALAIAEKRKELGMTRTDEELYAEDMADMAGWDVDALIAALESAPAGSRELDIAIHKSLGWVAAPVGWWNEAGTTYGYREVSCYTTSIDARIPDENIVEMHKLPSGRYEAIHGRNGEFFSGTHAVEAIARRIAALKARGQP